ncbi:uncharacterized protein BX663DRAFT_516533 [Cokeromyces recurvatus]|uniref:uncharacterized protein n=1 Tax=Cokeromyces recurvatus TaxID=90255 RepID=UPI002220A7A4|nr:uncharacterized protein BX663DRAFT_516533 [Cokeromyces recurvatus]KAI7900788.1 hypothetical protein BX663DRAFT_516533 [Cokeromyces recurvatus]
MKKNNADTDPNEITQNTHSSSQSESRSYCKYCLHKIHATRNISGICINCKKRKYETCPEFSFAEGSKRVLTDSNFDQHQTIQYTKFANCQPMKLEFFKQNSSQIVSTYCLLSNENSLMLSKNIPFQNDIVSEVFSGRISFSRDQNGKVHNDHQEADTAITNNMNNDDSILQMSVRASATPNIINKLGPYTKISSEVKKILNFDYRLKPQLLELIPALFHGAIIQDSSIALVVLTSEVYSRSNNIDIHSESTEYSMPDDNNNINCSVHIKSDGGKEVQKLIIGSTSLNILIVSSVEISKDPKVHVGPGVDFGQSRISPETCSIFVRTACEEQLLKRFGNSQSIPTSLNNMRQLLTHFSKVSTYKPWRSSLHNFDTTLTMPATTVTLCSMPSCGYGFGPNSLASISSQLLQIIAIAVVYNKCILKINQLEDFFLEYDPIIDKKNDYKDWEPMCKIVIQLKKEFKKGEEINVIKFCLENNISIIAKGLSSAISTANVTIIKNIKNKFLSLYK